MRSSSGCSSMLPVSPCERLMPSRVLFSIAFKVSSSVSSSATFHPCFLFSIPMLRVFLQVGQRRLAINRPLPIVQSHALNAGGNMTPDEAVEIVVVDADLLPPFDHPPTLRLDRCGNLRAGVIGK